MLLDPSVEARVKEWLEDSYYDKTTQAEVQALSRDPVALQDAFYTTLSFGTGGLRGLMGVGTNRMNKYTVRQATQALANYILKAGDPKAGVFIGFDSRHNSPLFALETARVLAGNGIKAFLLNELRPTPFISFGCRTKKCQAAVMITASHNPKEYNGYKVYWSDGAQVVPPHDSGIMKEAAQLGSWHEVKLASENDPLIEHLGAELDSSYIAALLSLQHFPQENTREGATLKIVYSSLHGTGFTLMPKALSSWGFTTVAFVEKQIIPNGDFPTVPFPNPEIPAALHLGIEKMVETYSDLLLVTDPDADRLGVVVLHQGNPTIITGNEVATLCVYFLCEVLTTQKKMPTNGAFVTTVVTTQLLKVIAESYGSTCEEVLTGFKYIGEKIHAWENSPTGKDFIFGAEESYGYLLGTHSRDKDAMIAGCLVSEIALYVKQQGKTLIDLLETIYRKYGLFREKQASIGFNPGKEGMDKMQGLMAHLRTRLPTVLGGQNVTHTRDFKTGGKLPATDMLLFTLADQSQLIIRPSGTEPKLKIYAAVREVRFTSLEEGVLECEKKLDQILKALQDDLGNLHL